SQPYNQQSKNFVDGYSHHKNYLAAVKKKQRRFIWYCYYCPGSISSHLCLPAGAGWLARCQPDDGRDRWPKARLYTTIFTGSARKKNTIHFFFHPLILWG